MTTREALAEYNPEALLADGFESALLGIGHRFAVAVAVYDLDRCIEVLVKRDGMTEEEAHEYFDFNVLGAYVGPFTPVFLSQPEDDQAAVYTNAGQHAEPHLPLP